MFVHEYYSYSYSLILKKRILFVFVFGPKSDSEYYSYSYSVQKTVFAHLWQYRNIKCKTEYPSNARHKIFDLTRKAIIFNLALRPAQIVSWGDLLRLVPLLMGGAKKKEHHFADYLMHFEMIYSHFWQNQTTLGLSDVQNKFAPLSF